MSRKFIEMEKTDYENLKIDFKNLTGKDADENLDAFLNYLVLLSNQRLERHLDGIYRNTYATMRGWKEI